MSREAHMESVHAAAAKLLEVQQQLGAAADTAREVIGLVQEACGQGETDAARQAIEAAALLEQTIVNEPARLAEQLQAELIRYAGGF